MGKHDKARFIAAATLIFLLTAPQALAEEKMGKEIRVEDVLKGRKGGKSGKTAAGREQTARQPTQGGDGYGVERPAPEGRDPNEVQAGGERPLDGGGSSGGSAATPKGGTAGKRGSKNSTGDSGNGDDLPPGDI